MVWAFVVYKPPSKSLYYIIATNQFEFSLSKKNKLMQKNSKGEIRTLDLTGMSRALSPAELPCHIFVYLIYINFRRQFLFLHKNF